MGEAPGVYKAWPRGSGRFRDCLDLLLLTLTVPPGPAWPALPSGFSLRKDTACGEPGALRAAPGTAAGGGTADCDQLVRRMTGALKIDGAAAATTIAELTAADLIEDLPGPESRVRLTDAGQARYHQIRAAVDEVTARLYGGIPAADLATAGPVLTLARARANAELAEDPADG